MVGMVRVVVAVVIGATVSIPVSVPFVFLPSLLSSHFKKGYLPTTANGTAQQSVQVAVSDMIGRLVIRKLRRGQVLIVSVEPWDDEAGAPWGHSNVRHNFGYRRSLPLFSGVSWHLLKRKGTGHSTVGFNTSEQVRWTVPCQLYLYSRM